jgi:Bacterial cell division membrane protein
VFGSYTPAVAGKTGTAEHPPDPSPNAWFASYAPANNPKLVVVALINDGGHGGVSAAPAARQVYQGFFHQKITNTVGNGRLPLMRTYLRHLDYMMLATALAITTYGLWILRNATRNDIPGDPTYYYNRQLAYAVVGVAGMLLISLVPPRFLRRINPLLYLFVVLSTMVVLVIGTSVQGGSAGSTWACSSSSRRSWASCC